MLKDKLIEALYDAEIVAKAFDILPFDLYLMGGSGCIMAGYLNRATIDFDFVDMEYSSKLNRVFKMLAPFDLIDYAMASIAPDYQDRARQLREFHYLNVYVLSPEDIIVSKIGRYSEKDRQDIESLLALSDKVILNRCIREVIGRNDFSDISKQVFISKVALFRGDFNVPDIEK